MAADFAVAEDAGMPGWDGRDGTRVAQGFVRRNVPR